MLFVLTGPESSAKTTLAQDLSRHFNVPWIEEASRAYLQNRPGYGPTDLLQIAELQMAAELSVSAEFLFADTDLQVVHIWWQEKFGPAPRWLSDAYKSQRRRHYLLCRPDLPWQPDPLRENPQDRERLFGLYRADLEARQLPFSEIAGQHEERLQCAINAVEKLLSG